MHHPLRTAAALLAALALTACADGAADVELSEGSTAESTSEAPEAPQAPTLGDGPGAEEDDADVLGDDADDADAPTTARRIGTPIAVLDTEGPYSQLIITEFARSGAVVRLGFEIGITPARVGGAQVSHTDVFAAPEDQFGADGVDTNDPRRKAVSGIVLVDQVNGNRHFVLRDADGAPLATRLPFCCTSDSDVPEDDPDAQVSYSGSALFPAPPADVTSMTVQFPMYGTFELELTEGVS